jgi:glucose/mannose-6-phosphate isomerase
VILDSVGMFDAAAAFPEQLGIASAAASDVLRSIELPRPNDISEVLLLGVGTSGQVGSILREVAAPSGSVPMITHHSYGVPKFVSPSTLVIAISCSGESEETLDAAQAAVAAGATVLAVCGGGPLRTFADENGLLGLDVTPEAPVRRAALGSMLVPALLALGAVGLIPDAKLSVAGAIAQTTRRRDELISPDNGARRILMC